MATRRTQKRKGSAGKYVVTAKFTLKSNAVSKSRASELVSKVRAKGGSATVKKA